MSNPVTPGSRLRQLAQVRGQEAAVHAAGLDGGVATLSWAELDGRSNQVARGLADRGVRQGDLVAFGLPNGIDHVVVTQAIWKLGACPTPLSAATPGPERERLLDLARPKACLGGWPGALPLSEVESWVSSLSPAPLQDDPVPMPTKAIASGGSTGQPKLIVTPGAFAYDDAAHPFAGVMQLRDRDVALSPGPLYHNQAFIFSAVALYTGATVVVVERFNSAQVLGLVQELRVTYLNVVPTMMSRMEREAAFATSDLSSVRLLIHGAAPCSERVKTVWIERLGPERVWEAWGSTEVTGFASLSGAEWLTHQGSVGRPVLTDLRIVDAEGNGVPAGVVGEIYSRLTVGDGNTYSYLGAPPLKELPGGYRSVGDLGWLDEEGYLYLADRRTDLIVSGGSNVYPAEVEQAIAAHPLVADVVVVGAPDDDLGQRVHAVVQPVSEQQAPTEAELAALCRARIAPYKAPRTYQFVSALPRSEAGKIRRSEVRALVVDQIGSTAP